MLKLGRNQGGYRGETITIEQVLAEVRAAARDGIIRPVITPAKRPDWPEAFYLLAHKTRHSYTLEAPSDFPRATRVAALTRAVEVVLAAATRPANRSAQTVAEGRDPR